MSTVENWKTIQKPPVTFSAVRGFGVHCFTNIINNALDHNASVSDHIESA